MNKKEFTIKLGRRIREVREEMGISMSELARRCGKDHQHIELIENGKTTCTSYTLWLIYKELGCPMDIFSFENDNDSEDQEKGAE